MLKELLIVFIACLLLCAIGFKNFVWFMSIGYGLAIAGGAIVIAIRYLPQMSFVTWLICLVFVFYGLRLAIFLYQREAKNTNYQKTISQVVSKKKLPIYAMIGMWVFVALMYTFQLSPLLDRLYNGSSDTVVPTIGALISLCGALIEAFADAQKSRAKAINPHKVAMTGLYKLTRCPNYWGELTMWLGVFIGGLSTYKGALQWILAILALVEIIIVMFDGAKRLEKRQWDKNKDDPEFLDYIKKTPLILPFIPLYTLNKKEDMQ